MSESKTRSATARDRDAGPLHDAASKVPAVTLGFWIVKIAGTTLAGS